MNSLKRKVAILNYIPIRQESRKEDVETTYQILK